VAPFLRRGVRMSVGAWISSMNSCSVAATLSRPWTGGIERAGTPVSITIDHGTEFTSKVLEGWSYRRGVKLDFVNPGNPLKTST
jgi:putative transposase